MNNQQKTATATISDAEVRAIIVDGNTDMLIKKAKEIGRDLKDAGLSMAQIRGVFGTVRRIQMRWAEGASEKVRERAMHRLLLLQPKLEYQAQRQKEVQGLKNVLIKAIRLVEGDRERFTRFVEFFEAILAYHVAAGGKTS